jgi:predicted PurR-regulated permease PerM
MDKLKKVPYLGLLPIIIATIIIYKLFNSLGEFVSKGRFLLALLAPFFWGFAIAYFLNSPLKYVERKFKLKRAHGLAIIYILFIGLLTFIVGVATPNLVNNAKQVFIDLPRHVKRVEKLINGNITLRDLDFYNEVILYIQKNIAGFVKGASMYMEGWLISLPSAVISITSGFFNFIIGIVISIYMLKDKDKIILSLNKGIYALFGFDKGRQLIDFGREIDTTFSRYLIGKCLDSAIIGILCLIILTIIRTPYAVFICFIVGITNMIPYFGPLVGMVIAGLIVVFINPAKILWLIIVIFLLQQFDGLYLGPKILGDQVGISALGVIFAVIVGGGSLGL